MSSKCNSDQFSQHKSITKKFLVCGKEGNSSISQLGKSRLELRFKNEYKCDKYEKEKVQVPKGKMKGLEKFWIKNDPEADPGKDPPHQIRGRYSTTEAVEHRTSSFLKCNKTGNLQFLISIKNWPLCWTKSTLLRCSTVKSTLGRIDTFSFSKSLTFVITTLFWLTLLSSVGRSSGSFHHDDENKQYLIQSIWNELTSSEVDHIFGDKNHVPKSLDIIHPKIRILSDSDHDGRPQTRRKRSISATTEPFNSDRILTHRRQNQTLPLLSLTGLGQEFDISLLPNPNLIDKQNFVYLVRGENGSEIIEDRHLDLDDQLKCFYHGKTNHRRKSRSLTEEEESSSGDEKEMQGLAALNLCDGISGFILSTEGRKRNGQSENTDHYYMIRPTPARLHGMQIKLNKNNGSEQIDMIMNIEKHHHFLWRRDNNPNNEPPPPPHNQNKNNNANNDQGQIVIQRNQHFFNFNNDKNNLPNLNSGRRKREAIQLKVKEEQASCAHKSETDNNNNNRGNHREKRSPEPLERGTRDDNIDTYGSYAYRPLSIPSDSYWLRHRTTVVPSQTPNQVRMNRINSNQRKTRHNINHHIPEIHPVAAAARDDDDDDDDVDSEETDSPEFHWTETKSKPKPKELQSGLRNQGESLVSSASSLSYSSSIYPRESPLPLPLSISRIREIERTPIPQAYNPLSITNDPYELKLLPSSPSSSSSIPKSKSSLPNSNVMKRSSTNYPYSRNQRSHSHNDDVEILSTNIFEANPHENLPYLNRRMDTTPSVSLLDDPKDKDFRYNFGSNSGLPYTHHTAEDAVDNQRNEHDRSGTHNYYSVGRPIGNASLSREYQEAQWVTLSNHQNTNGGGGGAKRKGRNDEQVFGENWKSALDSESAFSWTERERDRDRDQDKNHHSWAAESRKQDSINMNAIERDVGRERAHLTIETAVFIDKDLFKHMQSNFPEDTHEEVTRIVLAMINAVQLLYQDPSLGHRVDFVLKRLEVLATDPPGLIRPYDIDRFLTNFCKWQKTENPASDADPLHWDHALILTGLDLYVVHQSGKISNQVVGLAPVAGMCTRSSSCTVNEGRHFESVYVVAHEIGHNLGMRHDGPQADNDCDPTSHIMSPTLGSGKITWSPCSKRYLDMFLETSQSKCLLDKAKSESRLDHDADGRLPGERFDSDKQCVLKYGRGSYHAVQQPLEDVCRDLHCRREHYTWTSHPALEGTFCGLDMWCRAGKCVAKKSSTSILSSFDHRQNSLSNSLTGSETAAYSTLSSIDGGWSNWSPFTDCSSACLTSDEGHSIPGSTGIRLAARRCDSPRPENGGRQCQGTDRRYKTCNPSKVCAASPTRPKTTEYANEVCARAGTVDTELTGRGYMTNTNDPERACSVWCETNEPGGSRSRGWSFPDGTVCKLIANRNAPTYCVAGKCQEFSCDSSSYFNMAEEECSIFGKDISSKSWFPGQNNNRLDGFSVSSTSSSSSISSANYRQGKTGWTIWESQSDCKLACLAPAKGLELVKRECHAESQCSGLALSVRLCKPTTSTTLTCTRLQTPFEYATKVCSKYAEKISGLSGIGMQLSATTDDKDRPCRIGCQDENVAYRFYMVNGEEGWFPAGTDCSRGDPNKKSYCMGGKCIDFGPDDTPMYKITDKLRGTLEALFQQQNRNKRQIIYDVMDPKSVSTLDQKSLQELVNKFPRNNNYGTSSSFFGHTSNSNHNYHRGSLDFHRPVTIQNDNISNNNQNGGPRMESSSSNNNNNNNRRYYNLDNNYDKDGPSPSINNNDNTNNNNNHHHPSTSYQGQTNKFGFYSGDIYSTPQRRDPSRGRSLDYNNNNNNRRSSNDSTSDARSSSSSSQSQYHPRFTITKNEGTRNEERRRFSSSSSTNLNVEHRDGSEGPSIREKSAATIAWPGNSEQLIEGTFYEWRKIVSDCSVACGKGIMEIIIECASGDAIVSDKYCSPFTKPGESGYADCRGKCDPSTRRGDGGISNSLWNWVKSLLPKRKI